MIRTASTQRRAMRRRARFQPLLLTLATLGLLTASLQYVGFSGASFVSASKNPANALTAGTLSHTNSRDGEVIISADRLRPGESRSETVTITGGGDLSAVYTISRSGLSDATGLAAALTMRIDDVGAGTTLFNDRITAFDSVPAGAIAPGASRTYRFTLAYPAAAADAALQGASLSLGVMITGATQ